MYKEICGFCPTQGKQYSITVDYINASTFGKTEYIRGIATCDYRKFGNQCNENKCPLLSLAPDKL